MEKEEPVNPDKEAKKWFVWTALGFFAYAAAVYFFIYM